MFRSKFLLVLALLLVVAVPMTVTVVEAQTPQLGEGTAVMFNDMGVNDGVKISLSGVTVPPDGEEYVAWLVADEQSGFLKLGVLTVAADGSVSHTYNSSSEGYTGDNLLQSYNGWVISIEAAGSDLSEPSNRGVVVHIFDEDTITQLRMLDRSLKGASTQVATALQHANLAKSSVTLEDLRMHAHHVINIIEGRDGPNYDASHGDPGDGAGILTHVASALSAGTPLISASDRVLASHSASSTILVRNSQQWSESAVASAQLAISQDDPTIAKLFIGPGGSTVISLIEAASAGYDTDGDGEIQDADEGGLILAADNLRMAATLSASPGMLPVIATPTPLPTPTPVATATPVPPTPTPVPLLQPTAPGLPGVGDSTPGVAQLALLASLALLVIGAGLTVVRTRRARPRA